jgi:hypothetical protein
MENQEPPEEALPEIEKVSAEFTENPEKDPNNLVVMKNITRTFGSLVANDNIT